MDTETALNLRLRTDKDMAEQMGDKPWFVTRGSKQRAPCWKIEDKVAMIDTSVRKWKCAPIYVINYVEENRHEVFDGAHRCEALIEFQKNEFAIEKVKSVDWETSPLREYIGKKFEDLPRDVQNIIKNYKFDINIIDEETANNPTALKLLWERLSKAGKPLNNFETMIPIHSDLNTMVLQKHKETWYETEFHPSKKSDRGQLETKFKKLLALSEWEKTPQFASMEDLIVKWSDTVLGKTTEEIEKNTRDKADELNCRLKQTKAIFHELRDRNTFHNDSGETYIDKSKEVPLLIILGRLTYWFPSIPKMKRCIQKVSDYVRELIQKNPNDLCKYLGVNSRNATFQKKLILELDTKFSDFSKETNERRLFTIQEKTRKLEEQNYMCPLCQKGIAPHQRNAGDHILEYCKGGKTDYENLQIVHKVCHEEKNMESKGT